MRPVLAVATLLTCALAAHPQGQQTPGGANPHHAQQAKAAHVDVPVSVVGSWRSAPFELPLDSELHRSVYGPGARSVRVVDLAIRASGEGAFTVTNLVRNRRGATVPGTRSVEELTFTLAAPETAPGDRTRYSTMVTRAERRYVDEPSSSFPLDGAALEVYPPTDAKGPLEVRYDTPEGTGSFWETLRPTAARAPRPSASAKQPG